MSISISKTKYAANLDPIAIGSGIWIRWLSDLKSKNVLLALVCFLITHYTAEAQTPTTAQIKKTFDTTSNPLGFAKFLNKRYTIDTISVFSSTSFIDMTDSLAYHGKEGRAYGPFTQNGKKYLVKILGKAPNLFYHLGNIQLDTSLFRPKFADSIANTIIDKIKNRKASFASMATIYSADQYSAIHGGDLGWLARGGMLPQLEQAISKHKKGDVFKVWTPAGIHIISIIDDPKKDVGFALVMKMWL
jgi:PPIC-type PPIASE domain